jgi:AcrR family transcriptional regulator
VGRSTFYTHFRDKDDLLVNGIHEMLGPVPSLKLSNRQSTSQAHEQLGRIRIDTYLGMALSNVVALEVGLKLLKNKETSEFPDARDMYLSGSPDEAMAKFLAPVANAMEGAASSWSRSQQD